MPFYQWDPQFLGLEIREMDEEHQILIRKMNAVYDANQQNKPYSDLERTMNDFMAYTITHFRDEEAYLQKIQFPGFKTHQIIHKQLLAQLTNYVEEFKKSGKFSDAFFQFLSVWLTSHIRSIDHKYADMVHGRAA